MKMKRLIMALMLFGWVNAHSQALRDINYSYLYSPDEPIRFVLQPVRLANEWRILYSIELMDTTENVDNYIIEWQGREGLNAKEGKALNASIVDEKTKTNSGLTGYVSISVADAPKIFVAKVINGPARRAYIFYTTLEENYPVTSILNNNKLPYTKRYTTPDQAFTVDDSVSNWIVSYYNDDFPPSGPAFSEAQAKVSKSMKADSVFMLQAASEIQLNKKGLYLFQKDTMKAEGFALRSEPDFPRYKLLKNLSGPMIYICTKQEFDKLEASKGDKKVFDRTVLSIAGDTEKAKRLIKDYFKRVELANTFFTSFKEGWKTDRGMIYIIFGEPDEVYKFADREVWTYGHSSHNATFNFSKAGNIFAPDNYVLIRDKKYTTLWYEVVDLWRKARF
jgi:GWxTD domain-containing protein